jgi:hypothetical protein
MNSDNRIKTQNNLNLNHFVNSFVNETKFKRKVLISNGFKNIDQSIPQLI